VARPIAVDGLEPSDRPDVSGPLARALIAWSRSGEENEQDVGARPGPVEERGGEHEGEREEGERDGGQDHGAAVDAGGPGLA
jgi:hypothetical protein